MPEHTYKLVEIVGVSEDSISDAVAHAIEAASQSLRHVGWFEVTEIRGYIKDAKPGFQVKVKVGFRLDEE
jgi:hypothetical protein